MLSSSNNCSFWLCDTNLNQCASSCCLIYETMSEDASGYLSGSVESCRNIDNWHVHNVNIYIFISNARFSACNMSKFNTSVKASLKQLFGNACKPVLPTNFQTEKKWFPTSKVMLNPNQEDKQPCSLNRGGQDFHIHTDSYVWFENKTKSRGQDLFSKWIL